jgi:hypothetical protein
VGQGRTGHCGPQVRGWASVLLAQHHCVIACCLGCSAVYVGLLLGSCWSTTTAAVLTMY